jgi:hypothetical protein
LICYFCDLDALNQIQMKKIILSVFFLSLIFTTFKSFTSNSGGGAGYSNAPSESNCTSCHSGASLNSGKFISNLNLTSNFTGNGYIPDSTYTISVSFNQSGISKFGFQTTVLDKATNSPIGTLSSTGSRTQKRTKVYSGKTREYIEHSSSGTSQTSTNAIVWTFDWTAPATNAGDVNFYVVLNATNSSNSDQGDTIYAKTFTIAPSSLLPTAKISASDTITCATYPINFTGSGSGSPTQYTWNFPSGNPSTSNSQNPTVSYNFPGTFNAILKTKNGKGESKADTLKITIKASPNANISGAANRFVCKGDSIKLTADFSANSTYSWSNGKSGQSIYVADTGEYNVGVTSTNGCSRVSSSVKVDYFNASTSTLKHSVTSDTACSGDVVTLTATAGFDSFYYYKNLALLGVSTNNTFTFNIDTTDFYKIKVRDSNGCISVFTDSVKINVNKRLDKPVTSCIDQSPTSVTFTWQSNPNYHNGLEISLDSGKTWATPNAGNKHTVSGLAQKTKVQAMVRALDISPCFYSPTSVQVCETGTCNGLKVTTDYNSSVCNGDNVTVKIFGLAGQRYSLRFDGGPSTSDTIIVFQPIISKKYLVSILDSNFIGCPDEQVEIDITVDKRSNLNLRTQQQNNTFCQNDTVKVTATSGKDKYKFFVNNQLLTTTFDSFYYSSKFIDKDSAWVIVEDGACMDTSEKIELTIYPLPIADFTWERDTMDKNKIILNFRANEQGMDEYLFDFGGGMTSVLSNASHDYTNKEAQLVNVSLFIKDFFGCQNTLVKQIQVPYLTSVNKLTKSTFKVYPSPSKGLLNIEKTGFISPVSIEVLNVQGQLEMVQKGIEFNGVLDISKLANGLYLLKINTENGVWNTQIVKN